jgi:hypothetical protein
MSPHQERYTRPAFNPYHHKESASHTSAIQLQSLRSTSQLHILRPGSSDQEHDPIRKIPDVTTRTISPELSLDRPDIRNWCISAVAISTALSVAAIVTGWLVIHRRQPLPSFLQDRCIEMNLLGLPLTGMRLYLRRHYAIVSTRVASEIVLLAVNVVVTALLDANERVNSTALLWFIRTEDENRPKYNTNSRLLTGTKKFGESPSLLFETHH